MSDLSSQLQNAKTKLSLKSTY